MVGAVIVKGGKILATARRGEEPGNHAEYLALEKRLGNATLAGATLYTTLEPCTTRNHPKVPCAERLVERKVKRVVIGMLDPDLRITGQGVRRLRAANIEVDFFPPDLAAEVEELNREFTRFSEAREPSRAAQHPPLEVSLNHAAAQLPLEIPPGLRASIAYLRRSQAQDTDVPLYEIDNLGGHEPIIWPDRRLRDYIDSFVPHTHISLWKFTVTSHGKQTITELSIPFRSRFYENGRLGEYRRHAVVVGPLYTEKPITLYLASDCPVAVHTVIPPKGTARVVGESKERELSFQFANTRHRENFERAISFSVCPVNFSQQTD